MRYLLIAAAALTLPAVLAGDAMAAGRDQPIQIINNNYIINNNENYNNSQGYGSRAPYGRSYYHGRHPDPTRHRTHLESHEEAVARIKATHSRYRRNYHPRSNYNSPPCYYRW